MSESGCHVSLCEPPPSLRWLWFPHPISKANLEVWLKSSLAANSHDLFGVCVAGGGGGGCVFFSGYHLPCLLNHSTSHWLSVWHLTCPWRHSQKPPPLEGFLAVPPSSPVRASSSRIPEKYPADLTLTALNTLPFNVLSLHCLFCQTGSSLWAGAHGLFSVLLFVPSTVPCRKRFSIKSNTNGQHFCGPSYMPGTVS